MEKNSFDFLTNQHFSGNALTISNLQFTILKTNSPLSRILLNFTLFSRAVNYTCKNPPKPLSTYFLQATTISTVAAHELCTMHSTRTKILG